jgi:hypothetical protein
MRELGHRGGKSRRKGVAEQLPEAERQSLRQHLREKLDHGTVVEAVERSLAGGNESARVAAVKFLADLELYRKDGDECPRCAARKAESKDSRDRINEWIANLVEHAVRAEAVGEKENERSSSEATRLVRAAVRRVSSVTRRSWRPQSRLRSAGSSTRSRVVSSPAMWVPSGRG